MLFTSQFLSYEHFFHLFSRQLDEDILDIFHYDFFETRYNSISITVRHRGCIPYTSEALLLINIKKLLPSPPPRSHFTSPLLNPSKKKFQSANNPFKATISDLNPTFLSLYIPPPPYPENSHKILDSAGSSRSNGNS